MAEIKVANPKQLTHCEERVLSKTTKGFLKDFALAAVRLEAQ